MAIVTEPIALDKSLNTTEQTPRNLADVLAQALQILNTTISGLNFINCVVVQTLPTTDISTTTIYLVPKNPTQTDNLYDEYINLTGTSAGWEKIGDTEIDLSNYYTKAETDTLLNAKADTSDIPTVNDGTLTIQQNGETKGTFTANQSGNSTVNIETPTSDIQTAVDEFETYNGGLLSECKVALSPIQDLHGYDHSWVGGAEKNKLPLILADIKANNTVGTWSGNVYTISGTAFEVMTDDADNVTGIKINGTNSGGITFNLADGVSVPLNDSYKFFGCDSFSSGVGAITYSFSGASDVNVYKNAVTSTISGTFTHAHIYLWSGKTFNNVMVYPMFMLASESDDSFAPYSNICPISGHTESKVVDDGKNLLPNNITTATAYGVTYVTQEDGSIEGNGTATNWANAVLVSDLLLKAGTYILSGTTVAGAYVTLIPLPDTGQSYSAIGVDGTIQITFENDTHVLVRVSARQGTVLSNAKYYPMLRLASDTDPTFVPYNGYQITVNLGGTYYSGILDVVSGELTVDSAFIASYNGETLPSTWISDRDVYAVGTTPTIGAEVCYKLATPFTIQLTPQQVKALVGENHLSAPLEGQEITESKYKQMFTFDDVIAYIQSLS